MKKVLITGSSGFTGHYLLPLLKEAGFTTVGLAHGIPVNGGDISCDLNNAAAIKEVVAYIKPTHVIHLAALTFVADQDSQAFYRSNLFGTQNLLEALAALPIPPEKIIIASSANVYGLPNAKFLSETICPAPVNHYAISKLAMEHMTRTWFNRLPIIITRPFNYTGPGQHVRFLVPKIVHHFQHKAAVIELGNLDVSRDFLDVRDVVSVYVDLLQSNIRSEIINICSGKGILLKDIVEYMNKVAGYEIQIKVNPAFVRENEIKRLVGDNTKIKQLLAFTPQFNFEQTLLDMYHNQEISL